MAWAMGQVVRIGAAGPFRMSMRADESRISWLGLG